MQCAATRLYRFNILIAIVIGLTAKNSAAQELTSLTLDMANQLAQKNYPLVKQKDLISQTANLTIENLRTRLFPQLSLTGQASYQSDVTRVDVPLPGFKIEPPGRDQYRVVADVSQLIYDGGAVKQQREMQQLNAAVEQQKADVELYKVRERVNQIYLGLLYLSEQAKQVGLVKEDIQTGIKRVEAQVRNGVAFKSNVSLLRAEYLKAGQRLIELDASRKGMIEVLSLFLGSPISPDVALEMPALQTIAPAGESGRPELMLFSRQTKLLDHQVKIIRSANQPKASLFLQGGYARPALNLLKNQFEFYYIGGIRFNWSLSGLYTSKRDNQLVAINKKAVDIQKEVFLLNLNTQLQQQQSEIDKLKQLIASDTEIVELRGQVKTAAKSQLENGVITASDYLREINAEDQARQALITHQIQLMQAQIDYKTISGKP